MTLYLSLEIRALVIIMSTARSSLAEPLSGAKFNTIIHPQQFDGDFFFFFFFKIVMVILNLGLVGSSPVLAVGNPHQK